MQPDTRWHRVCFSEPGSLRIAPSRGLGGDRNPTIRRAGPCRSRPLSISWATSNRSGTVPPVPRTGFLETALRSVHPRAAEWFDPRDVRGRLADEIDLALRYTEDLERAREFHDAAPRPGARTEDYRQHLVDLGGGRRALIAVRMKGGVDGPAYVHVTARDFPAHDAVGMRRLVDAARERYRVFQPLWVRVRTGSHEPPPNAGDLEVRPDDRYLVGRARDLLAGPAPARTADVTLSKLADTSFYATYRGAMEDLRAASPMHRDEVQIQPLEDFEEAIAQGWAFRAEVGGEWAGIIAASRGAEWYLDGLCMREFFLFGPFRGQGLAPAMQRRFLERAGERIVFGTVFPGNAPSYRSALRNGRTDVGGWDWVERP